MSATRITGGCQCGAVRYALHAAPSEPHICHCRMCQKAFGSWFAPLAVVAAEAFEVTRGGLALFRSSDLADRGFCRDCGTPLTFSRVGSGFVAVSIGSLDEPERVPPLNQSGKESRMPWFAVLAALPGETTTEQYKPALTTWIAATSHQHPDHDTDFWPIPSRGAT
jgi:hypothetical protein